MILLDVVEAERRKVVNALTPGPSLRHPEAARPPSSSSLTLPDYAASQAQAGYQKLEDGQKPAKSGGRRLARAIVYSLIIYSVLSVAIGVPLFILLRNNARKNEVQSSQNWMKTNGKLPPPPPPPPLDPLLLETSNLSEIFGVPVQCNDWTYISTAPPNAGGAYYQLQYSLPLNETLYIRSNFSEIDDDEDINSRISGNLHVGVVDDSTGPNATVTVTISDIGDDALREASVCLMNGNATWGLYILVPDDVDENKYYFDVDLKLPSAQSPCPLATLTTYLPSFNQTFEQLDSYTDLDTFDVEGSLGDIYVESAHAKNIIVKTSAASISGTFNASNKVVLETVLQPITADVSLYNEGYDEQPSFLSLETGNSNITLNVTLRSHSNGAASCPPTFMSKLKTFSGSIQAAYNHEPSLVSSLLFVRAANSVEPAQVFVDRVFQGTYAVHTTLADAMVDLDENLADPSGAGRKRLYQDDLVTSNSAYGWVGWDSRPSGPLVRQGHIEVLSSLSPAVLQLTGVPDVSYLVGKKIAKSEFPQDLRTGS